MFLADHECENNFHSRLVVWNFDDPVVLVTFENLTELLWMDV